MNAPLLNLMPSFVIACMTAVPVLAGLVCLVCRGSRALRRVLLAMCIVLGLGCLELTRQYLAAGAPITVNLPPALEGRGLVALEGVLALLLIGLPLRARRYDIAALALASAGLGLGPHLAGHEAAPVEPFLIVDGLALIMVFVVAVIGGLVTLHAVGYMHNYHQHHAESPDRRSFFFCTVAVFLAAMLGLVLVNHLGWLFACWEITTLCSFLLIGYSRTGEARNNAFRALRFNVLGGLAFSAALFYLGTHHIPPALTSLVPRLGDAAAPGSGGWQVLLPVSLLAIAALTKSAQMPFSSWLLGAMVAPSTVSALLHSSTMVKAGVYLLIRLAPSLPHTTAGLLLSFVGALTFMLASFLAVPQRNAKLVLAYSTIANLGLIVTCACTGDQRAIWAAVLLLVFHAVAKALLFLAVGTLEHKIGSRDIEDMDGLMVRRPVLAVILLIGMAGMFLAPFGMLVSKWAAIEALVQVNLILPLLVAFGSGATLFFWCKWMGKILGQPDADSVTAASSQAEERVALLSLAALTVLLCAGYPLLSSVFIEPDLQRLFGRPLALGSSVLWIMPMMLVTIALLPLVLLVRRSKQAREVAPYLCGANTGDSGSFVGSMGRTPELELKNYYLGEIFPDAQLRRAGVWCCGSLLLALLVVVNL